MQRKTISNESRRYSMAVLLAMAALVAILATSALGQSPAPAAAPEAVPARETPQPVAVSKPPSSDMLQNHGNSLLRASLATPTDSQTLRTAQVSYIAVPEATPRVLKKQDLVTIIIREESETSSKGSSDSKKETSVEARVEEWVTLNLKKILLQGGGEGPVPPSVKASGTREFKGEGSADRTDSFTARVQARVIDIKPNGNVVLEARKSIVTDDEEQMIMLSGTCRAEDVSADNSVYSHQLYDLRVSKTHKGMIYDATRRGWIPRTVDQINPF